jgi:riboflavin kinase/FMN adenylyltransferase
MARNGDLPAIARFCEHMRRHQPHTPIPADARGAALALGNFDGVHLGHQAVIAAAQARGLALAVAVFEPHPRRFLKPDAAPFRLQTSAQRAAVFARLGVDEVFEIGFDATLTQLSDASFAQTILTHRLGAAHVSVGHDFRFGRGRMGDVASLTRFGGDMGFSVSATALVESEGMRVSSTTIRELIATGGVERAAALLGRPWAIEGVVQRGFARGRGFGFATANLALGEYVRPRLGIYAVRARIDGALFAGVASVGVNPTVGALPEPVLEAHLFNFDADLYGQTIEVEFAKFLRDEAKFDDVEALKAQMAADVHAARVILG